MTRGEYHQGQARLCSGTLLSPWLGPPQVEPAEETCRAVSVAIFIPSTGSSPPLPNDPVTTPHTEQPQALPYPCPIEAKSLKQHPHALPGAWAPAKWHTGLP